MTRATRAAEHEAHRPSAVEEAASTSPRAVAAAAAKVDPGPYRALSVEADARISSALGSIGAADRAEDSASRREHLEAATAALLTARTALLRIAEAS